MIRVELRRDDGEITRVDGVAAIAAVLQTDVMLPTLDPDDKEAMLAALEDMPVVSLRCDNEAQLAVLLGTLLGTVADLAPNALAYAGVVARHENRDLFLRGWNHGTTYA